MDFSSQIKHMLFGKYRSFGGRKLKEIKLKIELLLGISQCMPIVHIRVGLVFKKSNFLFSFDLRVRF